MTDERSAARPRWWVIALVILGIGALAFAIGRFSTFGSSGAGAAPTSDSADAGFARDMQIHHAQAVEMAMEIYRTTEDDELRVLSYDIATGQAAQRGEMFDWLVKWGLPQSGGPMMAWMTSADGGHDGHGGASGEALTEEELRVAMGMASADELSALREATGQEADCLFLELMIRHHQGAIPMTEALLELGSDPRAREVAQSMKNGQTAEIGAMQAMQLRLGCS